MTKSKLNKHPLCHSIAGAVLTLSGLVGAADPRYGHLPPGSISISETREVNAEICRDHLFDPSAASSRFPAGYRLIHAEEAARSNHAIEPLLLADPKLRRYALGSLCFMSAGKLFVDDMPAHDDGPVSIAFWWAAAAGPRHADMRGKAAWVQLGSWYPLTARNQPAIRTSDPMTQFVDLQMQAVWPNHWRTRLALAGESVSATVTSSRNRSPSRAVQPGYMSVPMSGPGAGVFPVYTYVGHHHQSAHGTWRAAGGGVFSDAFLIPGDYTAFSTVFQDGWSSRAGLYRFAAP